MPTFNIPAQVRSSGVNRYGPFAVGASTLASFSAAFTMPVVAERTDTAARFDCMLEISITGSTTEFKPMVTCGGWTGSTNLGKNSTVVNPAPNMAATWQPGLVLSTASLARVTSITSIPMSIGASVTVTS